VRKFVVTLCLVGMTIPGLAGAADIFEKVGTFDGQFLKIDVGARASGMGGAFVAISDDASALYWNCAGIARIEGSQLSLNNAMWIADMQFNQIGYVFHVKKFPGAFGVNARSLSMKPMVETTAYQPDPVVGTGRTFDAGMMSLGLTYSRSFTDKFSAGVTANFINEGLADLSQQTYAFDIGTLYDVGTLGMKIGMSIENIGTQVKFIEREGRIPSIFRVGTSFQMLNSAENKLVGSFDFSHPPDNAERMNVGAEYTFHDFLRVRGGYNINYDAQALAGGVGFRFPISSMGKADLDYAYTDMGDLGGVHRFSLQFGF
jgi:hypothetical protein